MKKYCRFLNHPSRNPKYL
ncbi:predicted coding region HP1536 [Helicobacter pylori 26695]|uniref:Uncharacterized protein n=1 Tax=Helicobacter pylori (strain ATCC 700392 / 26695) TaxID=85962 RepID=O26062_HELPY|nr:predicted coding region HP1536 [Helicobacter pylori 26695]